MNHLRPQMWLSKYTQDYPSAFEVLSGLRPQFSEKWPAWCYMPTSTVEMYLDRAYKELSDTQHMLTASALTALAAWRMTKGVYRFDTTTFDTLWTGGIEGDIPVSELYRLPEWCVYIEVEKEIPTKFGAPMRLHGYFARLNPKTFNEYDSLELVIDVTQSGRTFLSPIPIPLKPMSLEKVVFEQLDLIAQSGQASLMDGYTKDDTKQAVRELGCAQLALVLYLCSADADIQHSKDREKFPLNPSPHPKKKREIPAPGPQIWETGYRIGTTLRGYLAPAKRDYEGFGRGSDESERTVTPHLRRAHWHTFWAGPRDSPDRHTRVKWLPPTPIGVKNGQFQTTLRKVK